MDWCDANAYCSWAGERLCGGIGGIALSGSDYANAAKSEWFNACGQGGKTGYLYGDECEPGTCMDSTWNDGLLDAGVASDELSAQPPATCHGAPRFGEVFQLVGGRGEWEDNRDAVSDHPGCLVRGGVAGAPGIEAERYRCDNFFSTSGAIYTSSIGIRRCC